MRKVADGGWGTVRGRVAGRGKQVVGAGDDRREVQRVVRRGVEMAGELRADVGAAAAVAAAASGGHGRGDS